MIIMLASAEEVNTMYLRAGNLFKEFLIFRRIAKVNDVGRKVVTFEQLGETVFCVLADASEKEKNRWQKLEHPITHTLVQYGCEPALKEGDKLILEDRQFYIVGRNELSALHMYTVYYAEERFESDG